MKKTNFTSLIRVALGEDAANRDITSMAVFKKGGGARVRGFLVARQPLVISGLDVAREVFRAVSKNTRFVTGYANGAHLKKGERFAIVEGFVSNLLRAERVALNFLQHLSGIATLTSLFVRRVKPYRTNILDTRKTTPGLRILEKRAVVHGGGKNHRMHLADQYLIKDNHIDACGGIQEAMRRVKNNSPHPPLKLRGGESPEGARGSYRCLIEVEARNLIEVKQALDEGVDIILLDNMSVGQIRKAVKLVKDVGAYGSASVAGATPAKGAHTPLLEVSGGVNLKNVRKIAQTGVSRISVGALTHSAPAVDIGFDIES